MLDWEHQIAEWRRGLAAKIGPDASVLAELESHLREDIENLVRLGQTPDEAARAAIAKIGTPDKLAPEFAKNARPWWPIRCVVAGTGLAMVCLLYFISQMAQSGPLDGLLLAHVSSITLGYLLTYAIGILALCYALRRMVRDLCVGQQTSWLRALQRINAIAFALTFLGTALGGLWAYREWGSFWNWDLREIGALATVIWQGVLLVSLWRWADKIRWLVCWGVFGDVVVTFAWFMVTTLSDGKTQLHEYGHNRHMIVTIFMAVLGTHLAVIAGTLAPSGWLRLRKIAR
jgi:hypothetical protein